MPLQVKPILFNTGPASEERVFGYVAPKDPEGAREGTAVLFHPSFSSFWRVAKRDDLAALYGTRAMHPPYPLCRCLLPPAQPYRARQCLIIMAGSACASAAGSGAQCGYLALVCTACRDSLPVPAACSLCLQ